jgi:hypothetical protein
MRITTAASRSLAIVVIAGVGTLSGFGAADGRHTNAVRGGGSPLRIPPVQTAAVCPPRSTSGSRLVAFQVSQPGIQAPTSTCAVYV